MNRYGPTSSPDYPRLMALVAAVCVAASASAVWPAVEHVVTAVLIGVPPAPTSSTTAAGRAAVATDSTGARS